MAEAMAPAFVGDVHGWSDRLDLLLARLGDERPLVFLGDLVDRGPDSLGVVARVHALARTGRARCVLGNHEWALLRSLGIVGPPDTELLPRWIASFGGAAVFASAGVAIGDCAGLRRRLAPHLDWLANLPWYLEDADAHGAWIAVHAGLDATRPWPAQRNALALPQCWDDPWPEALFAKTRCRSRPPDLDACIVSGHTPQERALATRQRILCDTSGGQPGRRLSAVCWDDLAVWDCGAS